MPHGYEGSGPEHSSARIERFIALAAEGNMRLANPTTAAQYFHLLRRQARIRKPRPLVVFTPKGLLRLEAAASKLADLTSGAFQFVLDDPRATDRKDRIERLVLCSGKVYYDMDGHERRDDAASVAIARVELLYPFAKDQIRELIASYPNLKEIVWAQEEPQNMGAWKVMTRRMPELVPEGVEFRYVGRPQRASPSEGYPAAHRSEQERIVLTASDLARLRRRAEPVVESDGCAAVAGVGPGAGTRPAPRPPAATAALRCGRRSRRRPRPRRPAQPAGIGSSRSAVAPGPWGRSRADPPRRSRGW